jgi:hypothetical protein
MWRRKAKVLARKIEWRSEYTNVSLCWLRADRRRKASSPVHRRSYQFPLAPLRFVIDFGMHMYIDVFCEVLKSKGRLRPLGYSGMRSHREIQVRFLVPLAQLPF